jgi:hypothetical protein
MHVRSLAVALTAAVVVGGCVPSLHPFYTPETTVYEQALVGTWVNPAENETWIFTSDDDGRYALTFTDGEGLTGAFEAHLVSLNHHLFVDLYPEPPEMETNEFYLGHLLAVHTLARLELTDSSLSLAGMNPEWVEEFLDLHPEKLAAERLENTLVLTAGTAELQRFVIDYMDQGEMFVSEADLLVRAEKK